MKEYQKGEFCKAMDCPNYSELMAGNKDFCKTECPYTAYQLHNFFIRSGYRMIHKDSLCFKESGRDNGTNI